MYGEAAIQKRMNLRSTNMTGYVLFLQNMAIVKWTLKIWALRYLCRVDISLFELVVIINWGRLDISVENVMWNCSWSLYFSEVVEIFFVQIFMEGTWFEIIENGSLIGTGHFRFLTS